MTKSVISGDEMVHFLAEELELMSVKMKIAGDVWCNLNQLKFMILFYLNYKVLVFDYNSTLIV